jgi:Iap family predicted aminopeptidase
LLKDENACIVIDADQFRSGREDFIEAIKKKKKGMVVFSERKKLTWSVATYSFNVPVLFIMDELIRNKNEIRIDVHSRLIAQNPARNVIGCIPGKTDSMIVFSAHYDHLGRMGGKTIFPGANDNASGVALMLDLAKHFSGKALPACSLVFIAFGAEEAGLIGSKFFTENPLIDLKKIKCLINLDLLGTGDDGIMVVNATEYKHHFEILKKVNANGNYFPSLGERGKARNSDHYYFSEKGVPSFFIYTMGGITAYHDIYDIAETLPLTKYNESFMLIRDFAEELMNQ